MKLWNRLKTLHQRILQLDVRDITDSDHFTNPYHASIEWLLEIFPYGIALTVVYLWVTGGQTNWLLAILALGLLRWLLLDFVKELKERLKK